MASVGGDGADSRRRVRAAPCSKFAPAFTLMELMVVVGIIMLIVAISFPAVRAMRADSSRSVGENTVTMAGTVARAYATRKVSPVNDADPSTTVGVEANEAGSYSGCAALFTPSNEIRIVENNQLARAASSIASPSAPPAGGPITALERIGWSDPSPPGGGAWVSLDYNDDQSYRHLNGFKDLDLDYIRLPADAGIAGIARQDGNTTNEPLLIAPPFAVWFDANGNMVLGHAEHRDCYIYYDGDYDGDYDLNDARPSPYNPYAYDPTAPELVAGNYNDDRSKYELPFERIETVSGVMVYSKRAFRDSGLDWTDGGASNADRWAWMKANGSMVLFTRQAGGTLRDLMDQ